MLNQKFRRGNLVHIRKGSCQPHFEQGCNAIILGSSDDLYRTGDLSQYVVMFEDGRRCAWYHDSQLELIDQGGEHLIEQARERLLIKEASEILKHEDLDDLGSNDIHLLLRILGYPHDPNGMHFDLWKKVRPIFEEIKKSESLEELKVKYSGYDIEDVWNIYHLS